MNRIGWDRISQRRVLMGVRNPGRVVGLWYLLLVVLGPVRLIYIPTTLFVTGDATATVRLIAAHEGLFRLGMVADLLCALLLVIVTVGFYRLFERVGPTLAALVVILGGVMPGLLYFVNVAGDEMVLTIVRNPSFLAVFEAPQRDALAMLLLRAHDHLDTAAEMLWGGWLFPLGVLLYRSRLLPRWLGVWLIVNGAAYVTISLVGVLTVGSQGVVFRWMQPALFGEMVLMLWLVVRGAKVEMPAENRQG